MRRLFALSLLVTSIGLICGACTSSNGTSPSLAASTAPVTNQSTRPSTASISTNTVSPNGQLDKAAWVDKVNALCTATYEKTAKLYHDASPPSVRNKTNAKFGDEASNARMNEEERQVRQKVAPQTAAEIDSLAKQIEDLGEPSGGTNHGARLVALFRNGAELVRSNPGKMYNLWEDTELADAGLTGCVGGKTPTTKFSSIPQGGIG